MRFFWLIRYGMQLFGSLIGAIISLAQVSGVELVSEQALTAGSMIEWRLEDYEAVLTDQQIADPPIMHFTYIPRTSYTTNDEDRSHLDEPSPRQSITRTQSWQRHSFSAEIDGQHGYFLREQFAEAGTVDWELRTSEGRRLQWGRWVIAPHATNATNATTSGHAQWLPIRRHPTNPALLAAGNQAWLPMGANIAWALGNTPTERLRNWQHYASESAKHGATVVRVWLCSWFGHIQPPTVDQQQAWLIDEVLRHARDLGLRVILVLDNFHDLRHGYKPNDEAHWRDRIDTFFDPALNQDWQRRLQYIIARWGSDHTIAAWELMNEIDLAFQPNDNHQLRLPEARERAVAWTHAAAAWLKQQDPHQRLITVSTGDALWPDLFGHSAIDLISIHDYLDSPRNSDVIDGAQRDIIGRIRRSFAPFLALEKPLLLAECGHREALGVGANNQQRYIAGHTLDSNAVTLDRWLWGALMAGACGSALPWWWDEWIDPQALWPRWQAVSEISANVDWQDDLLAPIPELATPHIDLLGWHSDRQVFCWPKHRLDTWYRQVVEQLPPPQWTAANSTQLALRGMQPNTTFTWQRWTLDGTAQANSKLRSNAEGVIMLPLPDEHLSMIHLLQVKE